MERVNVPQRCLNPFVYRALRRMGGGFMTRRDCLRAMWHGCIIRFEEMA